MILERTNSAGKQPAPAQDARQAPKSEPKKPEDNKAAKQAPKETKQAVQNSFGSVPKDSAPRAPLNVKRTVTDAPKTAQTTDGAAPSPVDPRVQTILDTKRSDGKTVKEKLDADTPTYLFKAAQDHYNRQRDSGEALDAVSRFYLNNTALFMAENGVKDDDIPPDKLEEVFDKDKIRKNLDEIAKDPAFGTWAGEQQANAIEDTIRNNPDIAQLVQPYLQEGENHVNALRRMQSDYLTSQDFADAVGTAKSAEDGKNLVTEGLTTLSSLGLGEKELLGVANTLAENIRSKYTPDAPRLVIDPNTNKPIQTEGGHNLAILNDGTNIALDANSKVVADKQGNPFVLYQDGTYKVDANNTYIQYDATSKTTFANYGGTKYMVGPDRKGRYDVQGRPLAIDSGAPVSLDANGKVVTDQAGNKLVVDPASGKAVTDPITGNAVVIDPRSKGIVQADAAGKIVIGQNGDPYAVDQKTGKFVQDAQGRYVQISRTNAMPGIVPGYVVDSNNTKVVVSPSNGKPLIDPGSGRTVVFTPATNAPELVSLDANGKPLLTEDGKNVVVDENGNTVVRNTSTGWNWLADAAGKYANDGNGHYIGVGPKSGLASPVDAKGAPVLNGNGQVPLWDPKNNTMMTTADGTPIVLDKEGNLLATNAAGATIVEEKTGLPYLIDPRTRATAVNRDTGRSVLLDTSGAAVEYNADDGYKYLVDPATNTSVKTPEGVPITIHGKADMPVAVNADGSSIKNPETGNTVVYNIDGKPAIDARSGIRIEITPDGKANAIDPATQAPIDAYDKDTGGLQMYNKDGSEQRDPATGNKVQRDSNGHRVEVDPATGKFATDANGYTLVLGRDNSALKTPDGQAVVVDENGAPVAVNAAGKLVTDPASKLPRVIDTNTGLPLSDPVSKSPVVVEPKNGAPVQADPATGMPVTDPATGLAIVASLKTGELVKGPNGEPVVVLPGAKLPVFYNKQNNTLTVADPDTGKAASNPKTGALVIIDPQRGIPIQVLQDQGGDYTVVDDEGRPVDDGLGNFLYLDKDTGQVVIDLPDGKVVDALTLEPPKAVDVAGLFQSIPTGAPGEVVPAATNGVIPPMTQPWAQPDYVTTPADRAKFINDYKALVAERHKEGFMAATYETAVERIEALRSAPGYERLNDIAIEDLVALRGYRLDSQNINEAMRKGKASPAVESFIKGAQSALNQMREKGFDYSGPATRYMDLDRTTFTSMFQKGGYYRNTQFMSTSTKPNWSWSGNIKLKLDNIRGVKMYVVSGKPEQMEIIVQPNEVFKVDDIDTLGQKWWRPRQQVTLSPAPDPFARNTTENSVPGPELVEDPDAILPDPLPEPVPADVPRPAMAAVANASTKWNKLGAALKYAGDGFGIATGIMDIAFGAFQIDDGIKYNNPYDIAAGAFNVAAGTFATGSSLASLSAGAAAGAALPLAVASVLAGGIAGVIDFVNSLDDDEQFADELGRLYEPLGILKDGWREKAQEAYKYSNEKHMGPDYQA